MLTLKLVEYFTSPDELNCCSAQCVQQNISETNETMLLSIYYDLYRLHIIFYRLSSESLQIQNYVVYHVWVNIEKQTGINQTYRFKTAFSNVVESLLELLQIVSPVLN